VYLVGFTIEIYYDARPYERHIYKNIYIYIYIYIYIVFSHKLWDMP